MNKAAARTFATQADLEPWLKELTQEEQRQFVKRFNVESFVFMRPWAEHFMDDYRELVPGFWFPAMQGYTLLEVSNTESHVNVHRELHLVEAKVDEPLADNLFAVEIKDGIQVYDWGHDPPLFYKQKADRTPEEWQKIVDEHQQQNDEWKKENAARDALVGQPAPELPKSTWLNSDPLSLTSLKDKVIVLDFWSISCGPCRNDMPVAELIHKNAKMSGIVVIGVHAAGTGAGEIEKFAKEMNLSYPILIDLPPPKERTAFGLLSSQLTVRGIPYSFVIDQEGNIAAHGSLHEVLTTARQLANKSKK
jgi:thiol-disulfide isomerase/thioredoxin